METLKNSKCPEVFQYFEELNKIPRCSGDEQAVSDWLVQFAEDLGLEAHQDEALNVVLKKPGTEGYEDSEPVILQGHMDMVCVKEEGSDHDFSKDPIKFIVNGDKITADQTTLGADNGIAVSFGLALFASKDIPHPPLELLITTSEETGMDGAFAVDPDMLEGRRLINIDAEEEGKLLVSCSGGVGTIMRLPITWEQAPEGAKAYDLVLDGLLGGHSGMEIDKQRGNANTLMGRILSDLQKEVEFKVASINGGSKHNAIPSKAQVSLILNSDQVAVLEDKVKHWNEVLKNELLNADEGVKLALEEKGETAEKVYSDKSLKQAIAILRLTPTGVLAMSMAISGLVQTSNNLGVVITHEDEISFESAIRSSVRSQKDAVADQMAIIAETCGAEIEYVSDYPEWEYNPNSELREVFIKSYEELYGKEPEIDAIHAGLETGLFSEKFNGEIDLIAFGPNLLDVHTPQESMSIQSVENTYEYLKKVLENLK